MVNLTEATRDELIIELEKREGVSGFDTQPDAKYCIEDETGIYENGDGPIHIITVAD